MRFDILSAIGALTLSFAAANQVHQNGRCAFRGNCGKTSIFGKELPCPDNGAAEKADPSLESKLLDICGDRWRDSLVCCDKDQLDYLKSNLDRVAGIISSCPACHTNFIDFFCDFSCSPDQSMFVEVVNTDVSRSGKEVVTELNYFVSNEVGETFFNSCKEVKFSAANTYAMNLIGGGATNYHEFFKFMGDEKPLVGSPFQINFPPEDSPDKPFHMKPLDEKFKRCDDSDSDYKCSCIDCSKACPRLPPVEPETHCSVGTLPCLSFSAILVYTVGLFLCILGYSVRRFMHWSRKPEEGRFRLVEDFPNAEDDDEVAVMATNVSGLKLKAQSLNGFISIQFSRLGHFCASYPLSVIGFSLLGVAICSLGWFRFSVEKDPVKLWVSRHSDVAKQKDFFDATFGPFYRAEQAFLVNDTGPVLSYDTLEWWFDVENRVADLRSETFGIRLEDACFAPTGEACVIQSIPQYFGGDGSRLSPSNWKTSLFHCLDQPVGCLPNFGQPIKKELVVGGYNNSVMEAQALISTWVLNNDKPGTHTVSVAEDWERALVGLFTDVQKEAELRGLRMSFNTEISLENELNKSSNSDAKIIVLSYLAMFFYVSIALGRSSFTLSKRIFIDSKFSLGMAGIVIVLLSVSASVGFFSLFGVKVTLIIAEVIPFLILAIGVDNIFILTHELQMVNEGYHDETIEQRMSKMLGRVGPNILYTASCETFCFLLGSVVGMPAVRNFALYASGSVFANAVLQLTMFVAVLTLDQRRMEDHRIDCVPFMRIEGESPSEPQDSFLTTFIRKKYAPFFLQDPVRIAVMAIFFGMLAYSCAVIPNIELGLDQRVAIPDDSYLVPYFNDMYEFFDSGPPLYFVVRDSNLTERSNQRKVCGRFTSCEKFSLANILEQESARPNVSFIADPTTNWLDDFFQWLNPSLEECCLIDRATHEKPCDPVLESCDVCYVGHNPAWDVQMHGFPEGEEFIKYFNLWIQAPSDPCPLGGKAPYSTSIEIDSNRTTVIASHFRTAHTPLRSQNDYINAYAAARRVSDEISEKSGLDVFPYSIFYVFFEQYTSMISLAAWLFITALLGILFLSSLYLGSIVTGAAVTFTVGMILVDIIGVMAQWGISLNALSLVNLLICIGIGVEFCGHVARSFVIPDLAIIGRAPLWLNGSTQQAWAALVDVGDSVISGITLTKLIGVSVLAFTKSKVYDIYYFRMWLSLVLIASLHGLVFLPILLSYVGREGYVLEDDEFYFAGQEDADGNPRAYRSAYDQPLLADEFDDDDDDDDEDIQR